MIRERKKRTRWKVPGSYGWSVVSDEAGGTNPPVFSWILETGVWDDEGFWVDTSEWID